MGKGTFESPASTPKDTQTFAIRETLDRPQILSTSRHISQGGVDIISADWDGPRSKDAAKWS